MDEDDKKRIKTDMRLLFLYGFETAILEEIKALANQVSYDETAVRAVDRLDQIKEELEEINQSVDDMLV